MKFKVYILLIYLVALTALPSVRAIKLQLGSNCEQSYNNSEEKECKNGKFVMSLNFSPVQVINEIHYSLKTIITYFDLKKETSFYEAYFISIYQTSIWHPPKFLL
ncbi:hypothetical protein [uncultured Flavobacterium sp.]|uniref:hypothetical protein n=1 Tax=uncultured Flavobacterium sp. TaxID=165435 RepID=UPI0030EB873C|tara:strand:- start:199669 stop:199983 length:315 start_codon:yes stop_codon:yes gene_type:complete